MKNPFISYAQNFEDVLLNRIFKEQKTGFYVDIGANHPIYDSVTKAFYERGWRGINIEPVSKYYQLLKCDRNEDINLNIGISDEEGELTLYDFIETGLSTFDQEMADKLSSEDGFAMEKYTVEVKKLVDICHQYINQPIDFLKIDVEGWEEKVIYSGDWQNFRPKIIIIEATIPNSPERKNTNICEFLSQYHYHHIYFDGLNDFYVAEEFKQWENLLNTPVNVFDQFITYSELEKTKNIQNLEITVKSKDEYIESLEMTIKSKDEENKNLSNNLIKAQQLISEKEQAIQREYVIREEERKDLNNYIKHLESIMSKQQQALNNNREKIINHPSEKSDLQNLQQTLQDLQTIINEQNAEIEGMKSSKFWKLRKKWFTIKRLIKKDAQ